ncbi:ankyrin [Mytilinidion resinicola]|uniref:Ankyrin n=1 Tax=Mytilinidion resinicola TaxID=574789 RepID=A0A6A6Z603_9PEZI|nr:ankyrin [Mytilinidion resinicola]KAF2815724.1 ankyrin [Mytilinidion resinicola]
MTPLLQAANQWRGELTKAQEELLATLLNLDKDFSFKIDIDEVGGSAGRTALLQAVHVGASSAVITLLECGADPTVTDKNGFNALATAVKAAPTTEVGAHNEIMAHLVRRFDKDWTIEQDCNIIQTACNYNDVGLMKDLLDHGLDVHAVLAEKSLVHHAVSHGNMDMVGLLVDRGASVRDNDDKNQNAKVYAEQLGHVEIADYLRKEWDILQ